MEHPDGSRDPVDGVVLTPEQQRRRRARNIAIAVTLAVLVLLVYASPWLSSAPASLTAAVSEADDASCPRP